MHICMTTRGFESCLEGRHAVGEQAELEDYLRSLIEDIVIYEP